MYIIILLSSYVPLEDGICTGDPKLIKEARLSFPSGHSSFTTYSMIFIIVIFVFKIIGVCWTSRKVLIDFDLFA